MTDPEVLRLYAAILDDPDDEARRLALADRLDRVGRSWDADRIRDEIKWRANPSPWSQFDRDGKRLDLLDGGGSSIVEPHLPDGMFVAFFDRGVIGGISVYGSITAPIEAALREHRGVTGLDGGGDLARWLAGGATLPRVDSLALCCFGESADGIGDAPILTQLRALRVRGDAALGPLVRSPRLDRLESLTVDGPAEAIEVLIGAPVLPRLRHLHIIASRDERSDAALDRLIAGWPSPGLVDLQIAGARLSAKALAGSPVCATLASLELARNTDVVDCAALRDAPLGALRRLWAEDARVGDDVVVGVAANASALEILVLDGTPVGDDAARAIAASAAMHALRKLRLRDTRVGDGGVRALAASLHLAELDQLSPPQGLGFDAVCALLEASNPHLIAAGRSAIQHMRSPGDLTPDPTIRERAVALVRSAADAATAWRALGAAGLTPELRADVDRWFVWQREKYCDDCHGTGRTPEGPCPRHEADEIGPIERDRLPPGTAIPAIAAVAPAVTAAEAHATVLIERLRSWGLVATAGVRWRLWDERAHGAPPARRVDVFRDLCAALGDMPLSGSRWWAHAASHAFARLAASGASVPARPLLPVSGKPFADLPDPFAPVARILELGVAADAITPDSDGTVELAIVVPLA